MDIKEYLKSTDIVEIRRSMLDTLKEAISDPERMKRFARFVLSTHDYSFFNKFLIFIFISALYSGIGFSVLFTYGNICSESNNWI